MGNGDVSKCKKVKSSLAADVHGEEAREPSALFPATSDAEEADSMGLEGAFEKHKPGGGKVMAREVEAPARAAPRAARARVKAVLNRGEKVSATCAFGCGAAGEWGACSPECRGCYHLRARPR